MHGDLPLQTKEPRLIASFRQFMNKGYGIEPAGGETDPESDVRLAGFGRDSDMAPGFQRAKNDLLHLSSACGEMVASSGALP